MIDAAKIADSLAPVRELLQPDGADIEFIGIEGKTALLRLRLESAECQTLCVMPRNLLEQLAKQIMQSRVPGLAAVSIEDPRET